MTGAEYWFKQLASSGTGMQHPANRTVLPGIKWKMRDHIWFFAEFCSYKVAIS